VAHDGEDGRVEDSPPLRLALIDQHNWRAALAVQVTPDQLRYVAGHQPVALVILAKAYVRRGDLDWEPLAVTAGTSVLGVVALAHASAHTELLHLAVDVSKQGQGIGSAAVELLLAHVAETRPGAEDVRLAVHPENGRAQRLYRSRGFSPNGEVRDGEPIWSLNLKRT
jgi:diamine N-acetyltransferase